VRPWLSAFDAVAVGERLRELGDGLRRERFALHDGLFLEGLRDDELELPLRGADCRDAPRLRKQLSGEEQQRRGCREDHLSGHVSRLLS
jgi:hypothetical protein